MSMETYNSWTVIKELPKKNGRKMLLVQCVCGIQKEQMRTNIVGGSSKMCRDCSNKNRGPLLNRRISGTHLAAMQAFYSYKTKVNKEVEKGREMLFEVSFEQFKEISQKNCFYCGAEPSNVCRIPEKEWAEDFYYNGIDRVNNDLGYIEGNMVPCCAVCNRMKRDMDYLQFLIMADKIVNEYIKKPHMLMPAENNADTYREAIARGGVPLILGIGRYPK